MKYIICTFFNVCILSSSLLFSQSISIEESTESIQGVWENNAKIITFTSDDQENIHANITMKTFYTFYYDGVYPVDASTNAHLVRIENGLYTEYWTKSNAYQDLGNPVMQEEVPDPVFKVKIERPMKFDISTATVADGTLWLPNSNVSELSIDEVAIMDEVLGYYIDTDTTYEIRYWIADVPYTDEKVSLKLIHESDDEFVYIDKYVKIGDSVYTSAMGLRTDVRNVKTIEPINNSVINNDGTILVIGQPYLSASDIVSVNDAINAHNSIPRPPRDGRARFVEPSIYKKLEEMSIEDFDNPYGPIH